VQNFQEKKTEVCEKYLGGIQTQLAAWSLVDFWALGISLLPFGNGPPLINLTFLAAVLIDNYSVRARGVVPSENPPRAMIQEIKLYEKLTWFEKTVQLTQSAQNPLIMVARIKNLQAARGTEK
jgi:hypothetical protein